jgi:hypothetical protein
MQAVAKNSDAIPAIGLVGSEKFPAMESGENFFRSNLRRLEPAPMLQ